MKIVINRCFGGFSLSKKARDLLAERGFEDAKNSKADKNNDTFHNYYPYHNDDIGFRTHPLVVAVVEELGDEANGDCAKLKVIEFDAEPKIEISDFDGKEKVIVNGCEI